MRVTGWRASIVAALCAATPCRDVAAQPPATVARPSDRQVVDALDSIRRLPGYRPSHDTLALLAPRRIAALAPSTARAWTTYVARSRAVHARDTAAMNAELRALGRTEMTRAPYAHDFGVRPWMTERWMASDPARRMADVILSFQAPNGGWSKHVDFGVGPRQPGQSYYGESAAWGWISTLDNGATTEELRFLALVDRARPDARYRAALRRGIEYLLAAQYPDGGWPQSYPLDGSYHDAVTFNDGAMVNALQLLRDVGAGRYAGVPASLRRRADAALARGVACILDAQVVVDGAPTAWGQQHDPLTLRPTSARSYELTSLTGLESAGVMDLLMELPAPSARVVRAVHAAADWYGATAIRDSLYDSTQTLRVAPGAGPLWARLYEIGTNRPIFSNRDGVLLYDWNLLTDRRRGYGWFTVAPRATLARYERWARAHPRPARPTPHDSTR